MIKLFKDKYASPLGVSAVYFAITAVFTFFFWKNGFEGYTFGFEYGNIAEAMANGRGFSDVFGQGSGATAWCPPFYVLVQFVVFKVFGAKTIASFWAIMLLRVILLTVSFWLLLKMHYSEDINTFKILLLPIFLVYSSFILQKEFDDKALNVLLSVLTVFLVLKINEHEVQNHRYAMVLLAVILPISNLSLLGGCLILLGLIVLYNWIKRPSMMSTRLSVALMVIMIGTVVAWGLRNQRTMGKFIPFKSNLWFEVHMSNVEDYDGIIRQSNWLLYHPMSNEAARNFYREEGEIAFLEYYRTASLKYIASRPLDFARKVCNRFLNAFLFVSSSNDSEPAETETFNPVDVKRLEENRLVQRGQWLCLDRPDGNFVALLNDIHITDPAIILDDWRNKKASMEKRLFWSPAALAAGVLLSMVPALCLLISFFSKSLRRSGIFWISLYFFVLSISPYILFSHYARYQTFQVGFFTVFVFLVTAKVLSHFSRRLAWKYGTV